MRQDASANNSHNVQFFGGFSFDNALW